MTGYHAADVSVTVMPTKGLDIMQNVVCLLYFISWCALLGLYELDYSHDVPFLTNNPDMNATCRAMPLTDCVTASHQTLNNEAMAQLLYIGQHLKAMRWLQVDGDLKWIHQEFKVPCNVLEEKYAIKSTEDIKIRMLPGGSWLFWPLHDVCYLRKDSADCFHSVSDIVQGQVHTNLIVAVVKKRYVLFSSSVLQPTFQGYYKKAQARRVFASV